MSYSCELIKARNEPYFVGQKVQPCGHYYPDVLRLHDIHLSSEAVRIYSCIECGEYIKSISKIAFSKQKGLPERIVKIGEERLEEFRESERERLLAKTKSTTD